MSDEKNIILPSMVHLLESGFENKVEDNIPKNITLVLGLTGSYKIDLIKVIADSEKSTSTWVNPSSSIEFPGLTVDSERNTAYYDYPEFDSSKTLEEELSAKYLLKKIIAYADSIKIILTISQIKLDSDDKHISSLLEHSVEIIKNFSKLEDSIALIVTKVENFGDDLTDRNSVSDEDVTKKITAKLIDNLKKYSTSEKSSALEKQNLINILLRKENEIYTKIGIFKIPQNFGGELNEALRDNKNSLETVLNVNTEFAVHDRNNFLYYITSDPLKCELCLDKLENSIKSGISIGIREIGENIIKYYENQEKQFKDFKKLHDKIELGIKTLENLHNKNFSSTTDFLTEITNLKNINIVIPEKIILSINNYAEYLNFIQISTNKSSKYSNLTKIDSHSFREHFLILINEVIEDLRNSQSWYRFLIDFHTSLSRYSAQESRELIKDYIKQLMHEKSTWDDKEINQNLEFDDQSGIMPNEYEDRKQNIGMTVENIITKANLTNANQIRSSLARAKISKIKLNFLSTMLESLFFSSSDKMESFCSDKKLKIQGQFVKLSDISKEEFSKCKEQPIKEIELFASNTVFIDGTLNKTGAEIQLSIIAPTWEIIDKPKIILDGKPGEAHEKSTASDIFLVPGDDGNSGMPGKPGGPSGSFLIVGSKFIDAEDLTISMRGGTGGPGQNGSDGEAGKDSIPNPKIKTRNGKVVDYLNICKKVADYKVKVCYECRDESNRCTSGGRGGKGGVGGKGGRQGNVKLIKINEGFVNIRGYVIDGQVGSNGEHGNSKPGGIAKILTFRLCESSITPITKGKKSPSIHVISNEKMIEKRCDAEITDKSSFNSEGIKEPESLNIRESAYLINDYKNYLISILGADEKIRGESLKEFIDQLDKNRHLTVRHDCMPLIIELQNLETQFYELHKEVSFLPFYESLLARITEQAYSFYQNKEANVKKHDEQWFDDRHRALRYLYTATLSKIISIRDDKSSNLILDVGKYLDAAIENIQTLNDNNRVAMMDKVREDYHASLNSKVEEALQFVPEIMVKIKSLIHNVNAEIKLLIKEVESLESKVKNRKNDLEEMNGKLRNAIAIRTFLAIPKMAGQILGFVGPIGATVGTAISGTSMIIESLSVSEIDKDNIKAESLPKVFEKYMPKTKQFAVKQEMLQKQLGAIKEEFQKTIEQTRSIPPNVVELNNTLAKITTAVEEDIKGGVSPDKISDSVNKVRESLEKQVLKLGAEKYKNDSVIQAWSKSVDRAVNLFNVVQVPVGLYKDIAGDNKKIELVGRAIKESGDQLKKLDMHKNEIYQSIIPQLRELQKRLSKSFNNSTAEKSRAALDISKWKMQAMLKDVKYSMHKMTQGLEVQEDIANLMEKLDYAFTIMIDIYDHVQDYRDKKELTDYIADINLSSDTETGIKNETLKNAIDNLKVIIQSNIVLEEYERCVYAVKQEVYPLAAKFLDEYQFPFESNLNVSSLATEAAKILKNIRKQIREDTITVLKEDKFWHDDKPFNTEDDHRGAFYTWKYAENKNAISQLLRGQEITLKSDITKGSLFSAVKFREIGINFKFANETAEREFKRKLRRFDLKMVHLGNSQYKCDDKFHVIVNDKQELTIEFSTTKGNRVFDKLKENEALLSPYALWKISLISLKNQGFASLTQYENMTIDLALEGIGSYMNITDPNINVKTCNDDLLKYYKKDESISGITTIKLFNKEVLDEIPGIGSSVENQKGHVRKRRGLDDRDFERDIEEDAFASSGACSSMKSSFVNNIFNLIGTGLVAYEDLNPVNKIRQWFTKYETNIDQGYAMVPESNVPAGMNMLNVQFPASAEFPKVSKMFVDNELPTVDNLFNDSTFCNHGNLLLLDLLIRSKSGVKYSHDNLAAKANADLEYAQHLAYSEHPK